MEDKDTSEMNKIFPVEQALSADIVSAPIYDALSAETRGFAHQPWKNGRAGLPDQLGNRDYD